MTKGELDRLGERLSKTTEESVAPGDLRLLQEYRISYRDALNLANQEIQKLIGNVDKKAIITYRVKRIESIISKMRRFPDMKLSRVQDIAGIRCIMTNDDKVYRLVEMIKNSSEFNIKGAGKDYIKNPKPNGYKSFHLIVSINGQLVEIQIRSDYHHGWATLVEITDQIFRTKIKEYDDDENSDLKKLLVLLSQSKDLTETEINNIIGIFHNTKFIQKITKVFCKNLPSIMNTLMETKSIEGNFYLFEVSGKNKSSIQCYKTFDDAEKNYFAKRENDVESNMVMAYCDEKSIEAISKGYFNYILIQHTFYEDFKKILSNKIYVHDHKFQAKVYFYWKMLDVCSELIKWEYKNLNPKKDQIKKINRKINKDRNALKWIIDFYFIFIFSNYIRFKMFFYKIMIRE